MNSITNSPVQKSPRVKMEELGHSATADDDYSFRPPPEAPVFEPTDEEFLDPLLYIDKIRPIAERAGICKIRPPADWQPPFAVDIEKFKFTPRIQRLNELEAKTRIKLNFLDQIAKFWELQGSLLRIPLVERRILDLYSLHKVVQEEGGALAVTKERKWSRVACRMGMPSGKGIGTLLKGHYEKILYPFDVFQSTKQCDKGVISKEDNKEEISEIISNCLQDYSHCSNNSRGRGRIERKSMRRSAYIYETEDDALSETSLGVRTDNKELKRLQFYGPGPKMAGFNTKKEDKVLSKARPRKVFLEIDPLAKYVCRNCSRGDAEASMLLCDGCDDSYHTFCLKPPLNDIPKGDWRCPKCVDEEVSKPSEAFGFEQAQREYTLQQFGEMADQFKSDYFNVPVHRVPMDLVEKEFWRIVSSLDEDITVEYGADLHTIEHGSGFPSKDSAIVKENPEMIKYADSHWNLNNLPILEASVLGHINADISGMKVPWMYVGMCFATFCWHNEDHWSYSINYLHWGEPKTWYGVPGSSADIFEKAMEKAAPELFHSQPDLLHQLTTIMNPNVLMDAGVPVYRTDQHAGEFVITFPRAYHAGFNQGYNFAEAVNFAPADWLKMGRECITHYASLHRYCVFSHDELICKMGVHADSLDPRIAAATYQDMLEMVNAERKLRKSILEWGVSDAEREAFELLPDDERQCEFCKTTCFLSAVTCSCSETKLVCLRHYAHLCKCPPESHTLRYRYTLDELPVMLQKLKLKAESFDTWVLSVKSALECGTPKTIDLDGLKALLFEAETKKFPDSDLLQSLSLAIQEAEKCVKVARQLHSNRYRSRTRLSYDCKLTSDELLQFIQQIEGLPCYIKEADLMKNWVKDIRAYEEEAQQILDSAVEPNENILRNYLLNGQGLGVDLDILDDIQKKLDYRQWLSQVNSALHSPPKPDVETLHSLISLTDSLENSDALDAKITLLSDIISQAENWEAKTLEIIDNNTTYKLEDGERHLAEGLNINVSLNSVDILKEVIASAKGWTAKATLLFNSRPTSAQIADVLRLGEHEAFYLEQRLLLRNKLNDCNDWLMTTKQVFLKENSEFSLLQVLNPRLDQRVLTFKKAMGVDCKISCLLQEYDSKTFSHLPPFFMDAIQEEINNLTLIAQRNKLKKVCISEDGTVSFCQNSHEGLHVQCNLCKTWNSVCNLTSLSPCGEGFVGDSIVLCRICVRSKRPTVQEITALVKAYEDLEVVVPEGEALSLLLKRIKNWEGTVKSYLSSDELKSYVKSIKLGRNKKPKAPLEWVNEVLQQKTTRAALANRSEGERNSKNEVERLSLNKGSILESCLPSLRKLFVEGALIESTSDDLIIVWKLIMSISSSQTKSVVEKKCSENIKRKSAIGSSNSVKSFTRKKIRTKKEEKVSDSDEADDSDELCAANECNRPSGKMVDWVQCDGGCDKWYHMFCVGIKKQDIGVDEEYVCTVCKEAQDSNRGLRKKSKVVRIKVKSQHWPYVKVPSHVSSKSSR